MCGTWGCDDHVHGESPLGHGSTYEREGGASRIVRMETDLLTRNDKLAERNRAWLDQRGIAAFNLMGAPGAGKTTLLEALLGRLRSLAPVAVLEGDQDTDRDAARVRRTGAPVVQINTGAGCHLDAHMVRHGLDELNPPEHSLLFIENVGNLVCPAAFALGEHVKIVVMSVTEGDDKPLKYPHMFRCADVLVVNKMDLLEHVDFDVDRAVGHARELSPEVLPFFVSASSGRGLGPLCTWITEWLFIDETNDVSDSAPPRLTTPATRGATVEPGAMPSASAQERPASAPAPANGERGSGADAERDPKEDSQRIDELLDELGAMVAPHAWQRVEELMHRTVALYGEGLGRIMAYAAPSEHLTERVCDDELVSSLLRVHGLHPVSCLERTRQAFASAGELLRRHGLVIDDVSVTGGRAHVQVTALSAARANADRLAPLIEGIVHEAAPELVEIRIDGLPEAPQGSCRSASGGPARVGESWR